MKPRIIGGLWVVAGLTLVFFIGYYLPYATEIPKLEDRVDELTKYSNEVEQDLKERDAELKQSQDENKDLNATIEDLQKQLNEANGKVDKLKSEVDRLKKAKPVDAKAVTTVGTNFEVTWYNDYGHTASGRLVKDGVTVAVDPNVIPLGTWIKLTFPNGRELVRRADDTGGAVKGHVVDIYANTSTGELLQRGRTHGVKVTILKS